MRLISRASAASRAPALAGLILFPAVLLGCGSAQSVSLDVPFTLSPGEQVTVPECGATMTFDRVREDSRCPSGVACVWEGDAIVMLTLEQGAERTELALHTARHPGPTEAAIGSCRVELVTLAPEPRSGSRIQAQKYRARLLVRGQ